MKQRIYQLVFGVIILAIVFFLTTYKLPYYIYQPGKASELDALVEMEGAYSSKGDMHLVTVRGGQATPIYYLWAKLRPYYDIKPIRDVRPEGVSEEEYNHIQLQYMDSSQDSAVAVAFKAANKEVNYDYDGVFVVSIEDDMPAADVFQLGDEIIAVDGKAVEMSEDLSNYVKSKASGETVEVEIIRDGEKLVENVEVAPFPDQPEMVGMGISLVTKRSVVTEPEVVFHSGDIGGPSAGLMFSLEIYDKLTEEDYTRGYKVCGTGTISLDGKVGPIGGIQQKVVASDKKGCDIFFAPNEHGDENSNYLQAKAVAEDIESKMKIIPVDSFEEALDYLKNLEPKAN
jgi:Lon-like protease